MLTQFSGRRAWPVIAVAAAFLLVAGYLLAGPRILGIRPTASSEALVQGISGTPLGNQVTTYTLALGNATTSGDLLAVVAGSWQTGAVSVTSVTDTAGDTWNRAVTAGPAAGEETELWYTIAKGGTDSVTVAWSASAYVAVSIGEYSGVATNAPLATTAGAGDASATTSHSSGATPSAARAGDLVLGAYSDAGFGGTVTAGSGYVMSTTDSPNTNMTVALEQQFDLGSTQAVTASFTSATAATGATAVAAFLPSSSGTATPTPASSLVCPVPASPVSGQTVTCTYQ